MIRRGRIVSDNQKRPDDDRDQNTTNQAAAPMEGDVKPDVVGGNNQDSGNKQHTPTANMLPSQEGPQEATDYQM